jgi:hypothetical protein
MDLRYNKDVADLQSVSHVIGGDQMSEGFVDSTKESFAELRSKK